MVHAKLDSAVCKILDIAPAMNVLGLPDTLLDTEIVFGGLRLYRAGRSKAVIAAYHL